MSGENHRIRGAGVDGWGATKGRGLIYIEKSFELTAETK